MRLHRIGRSLIVILALAAIACGERGANSLLAPTVTSDGTAAPVTITGRIGESAPTETVGIPKATVRITDSGNAGRSATTDVWGVYTLTDVQPGSFRIVVTADGYVDGSQIVSAYADTAVNVHLMPVLRTMNHTSTGTIAANDGTCSDGVSLRPCRILAIPVHNQGPITATLKWVGGNQADLDLSLFQSGQSSPVARSNGSGAGPEHIAETVRGGALYELRMTWAAGSGSAQYTLEVSYPY